MLVKEERKAAAAGASASSIVVYPKQEEEMDKEYPHSLTRNEATAANISPIC